MQSRQEEEILDDFLPRGETIRHDHPTLSCLNGTNVIYNDKFTSTRPLTSV